jgi:hypothetical protein
VVKLVMAAGHPVVKTDQGAKQIVFQASGGWLAYTQEVNVSVVSVDADETIVTIAVQAHGQSSLTEGGKQQELIKFVVDELRKKFPLYDESDASSPAASKPVTPTAARHPVAPPAVGGPPRRTASTPPQITPSGRSAPLADEPLPQINTSATSRSRGKSSRSGKSGTAVFLGLNQSGVIAFIILLLVCLPLAWLPWVVKSCKA